MTKKVIKKTVTRYKSDETPADSVREKLAAKGITAADVADTIDWARKQSPR